MNDYWVVVEHRTGRVIAHCGEERDALMLCEMRPTERTYRKQRFIMDQVIDVTSTSQKQLPTNDIVVNMDGGVGGSWKVEEPKQLEGGQLKLPESELEPLNLS